MKKVIGSLIAAGGLLCAACDDVENSFVQVIHPNGYSTLYADQTEDSLVFATTYNWQISTSDAWIHIEGDSLSGIVPEGYYMVKRLNVRLDANDGPDTVRMARINLIADGDTYTAAYVQYNYLNVGRPARKNGQFALQDSALQAGDSITFQTYSDDWKLELRGKPAWVRLDADSAVTGRAGKHAVRYLLEQNTAEAERTAVLELTSRGVTTDILIRQSGMKAGED